jgi:hypothetical protein
MKKLENFKNSVQLCCSLMKKNKYYKNSDLKEVILQVYNIYMKNKDLHEISLLRNGNLKLSKNIIIWNMPSIITCACACKGCYALKAERMYKQTRIMRLRNLLLILLCQHDYKFKKRLQDRIIELLRVHALLYKNPILRIHESGDFFTSFYIKFWEEILKQVKINAYNIRICYFTNTRGGKNEITSKKNIR